MYQVSSELCTRGGDENHIFPHVFVSLEKYEYLFVSPYKLDELGQEFKTNFLSNVTGWAR